MDQFLRIHCIIIYIVATHRNMERITSKKDLISKWYRYHRYANIDCYCQYLFSGK